MKYLLTILLLLFVIVFSVPAHAPNTTEELSRRVAALEKHEARYAVSLNPPPPAFLRGIIKDLVQVRDVNGTVITISFSVLMVDGTLPGETRMMGYSLTPAEFAALPVGAAAKRAQLIALIKREVHKSFNAWAAEIVVRPQPPLVRDPVTDLGVSEVLDWIGEAP